MIGCQKDDSFKRAEGVQQVGPSDYNITQIGNEEIEGNNKLMKKLTAIREKTIETTTDSQSKIVYSSQYAFSINTDYVTYIESSDASYHSYTFQIRRELETDSLENLLFSLQPDGNYKTSIVTYAITAKEKEDFTNELYVDFTDKISSVDIDGDNLMSNLFGKQICEYVIVGGYCSGEMQHPGGLETDGSNCPAHVPIVEQQCSYGGGGWEGPGFPPENPNPNNGEGNNNNNGGPGTGSTGTNPDVTAPTTCRGRNCPELFDFNFEKNCEELNKLTSNPPSGTTNPYITGNNKNTRIAVTTIDDQLNQNFEYGYGFYNKGQFNNYGAYAHNIPSSQDNHVHFPPVGYQFGTIHSHPDDDVRIPMFSHDDIYSLLAIKNSYNPVLPNPNGDALFVSVLVVKQGGQTKTYAIKIDALTNLQGLESIHQNDNDWSDLEDLMRSKYTDAANGVNGSPNQYQKAFLNLINDLNMGVSLYEMEQSNIGSPNVAENWSKLSLDSNSPNGIKKTQCN